MSEIGTKARKALPDSAFADPANRAYPIHDKAHADNAAARLEQQKGSMAPAKYRQVKSRIASAQRRFGEKKSKMRLSVRAHLGEGGELHVRHMSMTSPEANLRVPIALSLGAAELGMIGEGKPVWIQLAKAGVFRGHKS